MNNIKILILGLLASALMFACTDENSTNQNNKFQFQIQELSDEEYPDNPDIGFRSEAYNSNYLKQATVIKNDSGSYQLNFIGTDELKDTITFNEVDLSGFIPTIPNYAKQDTYLSNIALVNQEWNRNQVQFDPGQFQSNNPEFVRVDIARNCLNSYLWEVILYVDENAKEVPKHHGWFNFPKNVYADLFEEKNGVAFDDYRNQLENWVDPANEKVNRASLRTVVSPQEISAEDLSDAMYPVDGERKKKLKEIVYPTDFATMRDLQNDSTTFATFTQPGYYNRSDPRKTELGRFIELDTAMLSEIQGNSDGAILNELELVFNDGNRKTRFVLGGINLQDLPRLTVAQCNKGWKSSMGFGNHSFYESYEEHMSLDCRSNPYYAFLADGEDRWLDSHAIGIDGPLMHWDQKEENVLHVWFLSFERHALVGHYKISIVS